MQSIAADNKITLEHFESAYDTLQLELPKLPLSDNGNSLLSVGSQRLLQPADIEAHITTIVNFARCNGLSARHVNGLISLVITPHSLGQANRIILIQNLFPLEPISPDIIYRIVARLGRGAQKAATPIQQALLKWMHLVADMVELPQGFQGVYSVLFALLALPCMHGHLCPLLVHISRQKHVTPSRIKVLQKLCQGPTKNDDLCRLIQHFNTLIAKESFELRHQDSGHFPSESDIEWMDTLATILKKDSNEFGLILLPKFAIRMSHGVGLMAKQARQDAEGALAQARRPGLDKQQQLASLHPLEAKSNEFDNVLHAVVEQSKNRGLHADVFTQDILDRACCIARCSHILPASIIIQLQRSFPTWNPLIDTERQESILELLSFLPILDWQELFNVFFEPLEQILLKDQAGGKITLMKFYTQLITRWAVYLAAEVQHTELMYQIVEATITSLVERTTLLALTVLVESEAPSHIAVSTILSHLESQIPLITAPIQLVCSPPDPILIYCLIFVNGSGLSTISRVANLLGSFKSAYELQQLQQAQKDQEQRTFLPSPAAPEQKQHVRPALEINTLNGLLIDTCNLLLRSRAFNISDQHAQGCLLYTIPSLPLNSIPDGQSGTMSTPTRPQTQPQTPQPSSQAKTPTSFYKTPIATPTSNPTNATATTTDLTTSTGMKRSLVSALTTYTRTAPQPPLDLHHLFSLSCHPALAAISIAAFHDLFPSSKVTAPESNSPTLPQPISANTDTDVEMETETDTRVNVGTTTTATDNNNETETETETRTNAGAETETETETEKKRRVNVVADMEWNQRRELASQEAKTTARAVHATYPRHIGPVSLKSLALLTRDHASVKQFVGGWREYRVHVLHWLEARGVAGVGNLGRSTMKGLMAGPGPGIDTGAGAGAATATERRSERGSTTTATAETLTTTPKAVVERLPQREKARGMAALLGLDSTPVSGI